MEALPVIRPMPILVFELLSALSLSLFDATVSHKRDEEKKVVQLSIYDEWNATG
jgi:hypothetical protein